MKVIKRDGRLVDFDKSKIVIAIMKAFGSEDAKIYGTNIPEKEKEYELSKANAIADYIFEYAEKAQNESGRDLSIEEIQDLVETGLQNTKRKDVARAYIIYRNDRTRVREGKSDLIVEIGKKLMATNVQNQNANVDERSFGGRYGEATNELSRWYALNFIMSDMAKENHLNNEIYTHDLDRYAVGMHNCYNANTAFVTYDGERYFRECSDGQYVKVMDAYGNWRDAVVRKYGKQKMYDLTFKSGLTLKTVTCTRNHRWMLNNGDITENIQIGDVLWKTVKQNNTYIPNDAMWCFGFIIGDGTDYNSYSKDKSRVISRGMSVRLCGDKVQYLDKFLRAGWSISQKFQNGDIGVISRANGAYKQSFLNDAMWRILSHDDLCNIFYGYISADGYHTDNDAIVVSTSDIRIRNFIEYASCAAGYYIWSERYRINSTNFKENREIYDIYLVNSQYREWTLIDIKASRSGDCGYQTAWCVEEPITHTFTLQGAMATGNCLSCPIDDLLANGFTTRQADVRPANSVNTACQLVAVIFQLQSLNQFGKVPCRV